MALRDCLSIFVSGRSKTLVYCQMSIPFFFWDTVSEKISQSCQLKRTV
uniref:Uncharacterized protein n=1 Tax=virus sp. ct5rm7 TaxID=2827298 RepID=A0A8S5RFU1_9VIRU|nr:MAG TPA: hypothetical protein [virus sp. ct5rm7]